MPFFRFVVKILLVILFATLSVPIVSALFPVISSDSANAAREKKFDHPSERVKPKFEQIRAVNNALRKTLERGTAIEFRPTLNFSVGIPVDLTIQTPSGDRQVVLYIPSSYRSRKRRDGSQEPVALQILFHGLGDECHGFLTNTGFMRYADKDGYILVSACGTKGTLGRAWNAGTCCLFEHTPPDDIAFAQQIVQTVADGACIDPAKVFATGFSNGGMLSEVLACEAPDVFRAVMSVAGVTEIRPGNDKGLTLCTEAAQKHSSRASVLMIHGDKDHFVPWGGYYIFGFPSIPSNALGWVSRSGCDANATHTTIDTKLFTNIIYDVCTPDKARGINGVANSKVFDEAIFSEEQGGSLYSTVVPSTNDSQLRDWGKNPIGIVRLSNKERKYQRRAFLKHLHQPTSNSLLGADSEGRSKAGVKTERLMVELVREVGWGHRWFEGENFSTTDYIYHFGLRVFGSY